MLDCFEFCCPQNSVLVFFCFQVLTMHVDLVLRDPAVRLIGHRVLNSGKNVTSSNSKDFFSTAKNI